jgi:U3 small nucleolar RNA-associated protein 12
MWHDTGCKDGVTCIARSPITNIFAIGHADGSIRLWNSSTNSVVVRFNGHRKAVTALAFDADGSRLASGSRDTDIIIWDVVAAEGVKRFCLLS